jgi:dihydroorotase
MKILIKNANIINEGEIINANVLIENQYISKIFTKTDIDIKADKIIDAKEKYLIPGVIDDQVHFREPGLTHKGNIFSESRAAAAGGVTSFMEMPNTNPATTTLDLLNDKFNIAAEKSLVNYSFYFGADNNNINQIQNINPKKVPGVKIFLGSSTGNLLVSNQDIIKEIFSNSPVLCAIHSENDEIINRNLNKYKFFYGEHIPFHLHPEIRSVEACYSSTYRAIEIAEKTNCRLHILHISTEKELELLSQNKIEEKKITAEVCTHHLWFNRDDYKKYESKIKWNPAIKYESDRLALINALKTGKIDIVATDHAPHTLEEKNNNYCNAPSGGPLVQHSLQAMIQLSKQKYFSLTDVVKYMCHNPADLFRINKRGYIREGYFADLALIDIDAKYTVNKENILYKCGWSPFEEQVFDSMVITTFVNGQIVFDNGQIIENKSAMPLEYVY